MDYAFPKITHLNEVLEAIEGREEFVVKRDPDYVVINYLVNFENTFPPVTDRLTALLRECRGVTFDATHGHVIARKYHKFFNLGEKLETQSQAIDFTRKHWILQKLDGSMITPMNIKGQVRFATKMGLTEVAKPVDVFASKNPQYIQFCQFMIAAGLTPIFEWCSRTQRIVIDYPVDRLVLTAVRDNITGEYMTYEAMQDITVQYHIELVKQLPGSVQNLEHFMAQVADLKGEEGYVIRFEDGHMLKVKGAEYIQLHRALDNLRFEKDVIAYIVLNKLDDIKALLPPDLVNRADTFGQQLFKNLHDTADRLWWQAIESYDNFNAGKKRFATEVIPNQPKALQTLLFTAWDMIDAERPASDFYEFLLDLVLKHTNTGNNVDRVRHLFGGIRWDDAVVAVDAE